MPWRYSFVPPLPGEPLPTNPRAHNRSRVRWRVSGRYAVTPIAASLLLVIHFASVRTEFSLLYGIIPGFSVVVLMLLIFMLFFAWLGTVLFDSSASFGNGAIAMQTLLVQLTHNNMPDVMIEPFDRQSHLVVLYFIVYTSLGVYFLLNFGTAIIYNAYIENRENTLHHHEHARDEMLDRAFGLLKIDEDSGIDKETMDRLLAALGRIYGGIFAEADSHRELVFMQLDLAGDAVLHEDEFSRLCDVLQNRFQKSTSTPILERTFPTLRDSGLYKALQGWVASPAFETTVDAVILGSAVQVIAATWNTWGVHSDSKESAAMWLRATGSVFSVLMGVELVLKVTTRGFGWVVGRMAWFDRWDVLLTPLLLLAPLTQALNVIPAWHSGLMILSHTLKMFRITRVLSRIPVFQVMLPAMERMIPAGKQFTFTMIKTA